MQSLCYSFAREFFLTSGEIHSPMKMKMMMGLVMEHNSVCRKGHEQNQTLLMLFFLSITNFERLMIATQFLIFVHLRNMNAQSIFALECFLAMVTFVAEMTREVNAFNVIP